MRVAGDRELDPTRTNVSLKSGNIHTIDLRLVDVFGNDAATVVQVAIALLGRALAWTCEIVAVIACPWVSTVLSRLG